MKILAEVIGGNQSVLTIEGNPSIPELAALAAESADRPLGGQSGEELNWILYVPTPDGGFAPANREENFSDVEKRLGQERDDQSSDSFAGPGESDGEAYSFRVRLFVPPPKLPPQPIDSGPQPIAEDEEVIDLTDIGADSGDLMAVRRVRKKRRRKRGEGTDPGTRRRRASGDRQPPQVEAVASIEDLSREDPDPTFAPTSADGSATTDSTLEPSFDEQVAFESSEEAMELSLTLGDGTLAPTEANDSSKTADDLLPPGPEEAGYDEEAEAATAVATAALVSAGVSADEQEAGDDVGDEEIAIGGATLEHADVELSLTHDDRGLNLSDDSIDDSEGSAEAESLEEEGETAPSIVLRAPQTSDEAVSGDEAISGDGAESDDLQDESDEAQTHEGQSASDEHFDDSEAMATAIDASIATRRPPADNAAPEVASADEDGETEPSTESEHEGPNTLVATPAAGGNQATQPKLKKRRRKRKKKPPPPKKTHGGALLGAGLFFLVAIASLLYLLHSKGIIG